MCTVYGNSLVLANPSLAPFNITAEYTARNLKTRLCEFGLGRATIGSGTVPECRPEKLHEDLHTATKTPKKSKV
jgi:hypothetical protein